MGGPGATPVPQAARPHDSPTPLPAPALPAGAEPSRPAGKRQRPADLGSDTDSAEEQGRRPCPAARIELSTQHLDRLVAAVGDAHAGRQQPRHRAQHEPGRRALRAGYLDALLDALQVVPGPVQVVVNGQHTGGEPCFHPHPLASNAAPRTVLLAIFGSLTAAMPPPEEVDPRPVAEAFWKAAREQYDCHLAPAPRPRLRHTAPGAQPPPTRGRVFPPHVDTSPAAKRKAAHRRRARDQQAGVGGVPS